jgi:hypothetical protein
MRLGLQREYEGVMDILIEDWFGILDATKVSGAKSIDPTPFLRRCYKEFGKWDSSLVLNRSR